MKEIRQFVNRFMWEASPPARIGRKVVGSLDGESQEKITKYLDWLYGNVSSSIQTIRQSTVLVLGLMAAFELIANSSATTAVTIFTVGIPKHSIIAQLIPAVVAFVYLQIIRDGIDVNRSRIAFSTAFELWSKRSRANELDEYIWPPSRLYWSPFIRDRSKELDFAHRKKGPVGGSLEAMFSVLFLAFLGQAYYILFVPHLNKSLALWAASLFFTLFCLRTALMLASIEFGFLDLLRALRKVVREAKDLSTAPGVVNK